MVKKLNKLILSLVVSISVITGSVFVANGEEGTSTPTESPVVDEFVLGNDLNLSKKVSQYGNAEDRIYQVDLTVQGDTKVIQHEAEIFILIDMTKLNAGVGNMPMWPYYMRAIWNSCDYLLRRFPERTFNFYLIAVNDGDVPVVNKKFTASDKHREEFGDPNYLYIKKDINTGTPILDDKGNYIPQEFTAGQMYRYYRKEILEEESMLSYLANMSYLTLPNRLGSDKGSMDYLDTDTKETAPGKLSSANSDNANINLALETMNNWIDTYHLQNSQAVMLMDTLPTASNYQADTPPGSTAPLYISPILQETYNTYEISKNTHHVIFHMFALTTFTSLSDQNKSMWNEFVTNIGKNMIRSKKSGQADPANPLNNYIPNEWVPYQYNEAHTDTAHDNYFNYYWDHGKGSSTDPVQKEEVRTGLNNALLDVAESVGDGLEYVTDYASFTYVQDEIPREFHIINNVGYEPKVTRSKDNFQTEEIINIGDPNSPIERCDLFEMEESNVDGVYQKTPVIVTTPSAKNRWKETGIRWKVNKLSSTDGVYKFTFYIQANHDYFGGETVLGNHDAAMYYMSHDQWIAAGSPTSELGNPGRPLTKSDFTKEDFIYEVEEVVIDGKKQFVYKTDAEGNRIMKPSKEQAGVDENGNQNPWCEIENYVPYYHKTQDGEVTIFYGDSADLVLANVRQDTPYIKGPDTTNTDLSPDVNYYFQPYAVVKELDGTVFDEKATWKDKDGDPLLFDWEWKAYSIYDKGDLNGQKNNHFEEVFESGTSSLDNAYKEFHVTPDETMIYVLNYKVNDENWNGTFGEWKPIKDTGEDEFFFKYEGSSTKVRINVEYGTIYLKKFIESDVKTPEELKEIDLVTGFPVRVTKDGALYSSPTLRLHEYTQLNRLKRGKYTLEEIVPQKFRFVHFVEPLSRKPIDTSNQYTIEIGFRNIEQDVDQNRAVWLLNNLYTEKWFTSIHEAKNQIKAGNFFEYKPGEEVNASVGN